jgi:hypothetical protein
MKSQEADRQNQQPPTDWGGGERHDEALVPRLVAPTGTIWRRTVLFGVPGLYIALGLMHPTTNPGVGDESAVFIGLHIVQLFLVGGLAVMMWMLVGDLDNQAATITRVLILPFVIAYTALDAILGIAWGIVAAKANQLPAADQAAAGRLVDELLATDPLGMILYWGAGLLWLTVVAAAVVALRGTAPGPALALITVGALAFATGHARPVGPIGMGLILAGLGWLELRPHEPRPGDVPAARARLAARR